MTKGKKVGRPSSYKAEYAKQAQKLCQLGATDADLADFFQVTIVTIWRWTGRYKEFCRAIKTAKDHADSRTERSLYQRANGYTFDAVKIFPPKGDSTEPVIVPYREHVPPDTTACIFWLKNRRPQTWRDKHEHDVAVGVEVRFVIEAAPHERGNLIEAVAEPSKVA